MSGVQHPAQACALPNCCTGAGPCTGWQDQTSGGIAVAADSSGGTAVLAIDSAAGVGVSGTSSGGQGVKGVDTANGNGVEALATSVDATGNGVYASNSGQGAGVWAYSAFGTGVVGTLTNAALIVNAGVYGAGGPNSPGVFGINTSSLAAVDGVSAASEAGTGVSGSATAGYGVSGNDASTGYGVYGNSTSGSGVYGTSPSGGRGGTFVALGTGTAGSAGALYGNATGTSGTGVLGTGYGYGVYGASSSGYGVYGSGAGNYNGVYGVSSGAAGVRGDSSNSFHAGVIGNGLVIVSNAYGVQGTCTGSGCYAGYFTGNLYVSGTICNPTCSSDVRLKSNVRPLAGAVDQLLQLHGVTFEWKNPSEQGGRTGTQRGFIAQEVEKVFPAWVGEDAKGFKTLNIDSKC
jgi:hypothetical protein